MANISTYWPDGDGLSRERWDFRLNRGREISLTLVGYSIERRKAAKGRFCRALPAERWASMDERKYNSGLPRPDEVPYERAADAMIGVQIGVYLGWSNSEHHQFNLKIRDVD